jgi:hypothetical protein
MSPHENWMKLKAALEVDLSIELEYLVQGEIRNEEDILTALRPNRLQICGISSRGLVTFDSGNICDHGTFFGCIVSGSGPQCRLLFCLIISIRNSAASLKTPRLQYIDTYGRITSAGHLFDDPSGKSGVRVCGHLA